MWGLKIITRDKPKFLSCGKPLYQLWSIAAFSG
jgi:hypothetical protein